jgi:hypothetical protein
MLSSLRASLMGDSSGGGVSDLEVESAGAGGSNIATGRSGEGPELCLVVCGGGDW